MKNGTIHVKDAKLSTATIEVRHLVVSDRKMTLSVFRQIPHEILINFEKGVLVGDVWGHVNYWWGSTERETSESLHIVWQKGEELRRFVFDPDPRHCCREGFLCLRDMKYNVKRIKNAKWAKSSLEWLLGQRPDTLQSMPRGRGEKMFPWHEDSHTWLSRGLDTDDNGLASRPQRWEWEQIVNRLAGEGWEKLDKLDEAKAQVEALLTDARTRLTWLTEEYGEAESDIARLEQQWNQLCVQLQQAPQIFIAV
jgi:hypothetical protein